MSTTYTNLLAFADHLREAIAAAEDTGVPYAASPDELAIMEAYAHNDLRTAAALLANLLNQEVQ